MHQASILASTASPQLSLNLEYSFGLAACTFWKEIFPHIKSNYYLNFQFDGLHFQLRIDRRVSFTLFQRFYATRHFSIALESESYPICKYFAVQPLIRRQNSRKTPQIKRIYTCCFLAEIYDSGVQHCITHVSFSNPHKATSSSNAAENKIWLRSPTKTFTTLEHEYLKFLRSNPCQCGLYPKHNNTGSDYGLHSLKITSLSIHKVKHWNSAIQDMFLSKQQ